MSDHIGGEPTAEDRVIYDPDVRRMIGRTLVDLELEHELHAEVLLERLVWAVVRWERGE